MNLARSNRSAFTLLELMVVVAIMGIILAIGAPAIYKMIHREALSQGVRDVTEGCRIARSRAILQDVPTELRISPKTGEIEVALAQLNDDNTADPGASAKSQPPPPAEDPDKPTHYTVPNYSAQLPEEVRIVMLDVNFMECKDADGVRVRFYPNGTCDEFTMVLHSMDSGEYRKITLEAVTALADSGPVNQ